VTNATNLQYATTTNTASVGIKQPVYKYWSLDTLTGYANFFYYEINPLYGISCSGDGLAERSAIVSLALVLIVTSDLVLLSETDVYT